MAKRNKAKFASKSRKSALRVEALEQRQLLATVTGGGTEVGSNIVHPNGNVYDQVLMTGASVTVTADSNLGQITRVSFLDLSGDIVQAEFSGKGSLTISLDQFKAAAEAANYNQPGVKYVQGLASFTIQGEDASTNFSVFSVGSGNAVNQNLFAGGKTGGNNYADVARVLIVADPLNPGGFSTMGGIRAGNAIFSDSAGVVGISATNVNVQGPVIVGDIDAANAGVPSLNFGTNSQFATLQVAGGDLIQTNGSLFVGAGFSALSSTNGTTSAGTTVRSQVVNAASLANIDANPNVAGTQAVAATTLDTITTFDLTGKTQAEVDTAFKGRTFTQDVTISGDLSNVFTLTAAEFRGALNFTGSVSGVIVVDNAIKSVSFAKNTDVKLNVGTTTKAGALGDFTATGNFSGTVWSGSIGNVSVGGVLSGTLTTDYYNASNHSNTLSGATAGAANAYDANNGTTILSNEGKVGNVAVTGNMTGRVFGVLGIGNVTVGGNITTNGGSVLATASGASGDAFIANIGTVTVNGDVDVDASATNLIDIKANGTFGDILVKGGGTLSATSGTNTLGNINVGTLGGSGTKAGSITYADTSFGVALGTVTIGNGASGSIGAITLSAGGAKNSTVATGNINLGSGSSSNTIGTITLSGAQQITVGEVKGRAIGDVSVTATHVDTGTTKVDLNGAWVANSGSTSADSIGNIAINATSNGALTLTAATGGISTNANAGSAAIGTVSLTGKTIAISDQIKSFKIGAMTLVGDTTFAANTGIAAKGGLTSLSVTGATTFTANTTNGAANIKVGGTTGDLTFNGNTTFGNNTYTAAVNSASILADNGGSGRDTIGNISFNGLVSGGTGLEVRASAVGNISFSGALNQTENLVSNFDVYAGNNSAAAASNAETVARDGSNLANYAIGDVTVKSTNTIGVTGTALFSGANSFIAVGKIGNISLQAGGSPAVQTSLFAAGTDGVVFQTGNGSITGFVDGTADTLAEARLAASIDFDGNGSTASVFAAETNFTGTEETAATFSTGVTASIGSVSINAKHVAAVSDSILGVGGNAAGANGLAILSGVESSNATDWDPTHLAAINGTLRGTVGNVTVTNLDQQLSKTAKIADATAITTGPTTPAVIAASGVTNTSSPFGTVQGGVTEGVLTAAKNGFAIGDADADATTVTGDNIVVVRL